jgi:hypothetical protein
VPSLRISQSEAELETKFAPRLWALVHDTPKLYESLLVAFAPFQLTAADLRSEGNGTVGGTAVSFWLAGFKMSATMRLDGFVVRCTSLKEVTTDQLSQAILASEAAVKGVLGAEYTREGVTVSYACHGSIEGGSTREVLAPFVGVPPSVRGLGDGLGAGAAFYFADSESFLGASLTADVSRLVAGGLFLRGVFILRPERFSATLVDEMNSQVAHVFTALGLSEA